jgi:hypothetical protein
VIAAQHEWQRTVVERLQRKVVQLLTDLGDVADVFLLRVRRPLRLRNRRGQVTLVDDRPAERCNLVANPRDPKRRRSHINASAPGAKVERNANQMDGFHG